MEFIRYLKALGDNVIKIRKAKKMNQVEFYNFLFPDNTLFDENNEPENTEVSESVEEPVQFESDTTQKDGSAETSEEWIENINEEPVEEGTAEEVEESVLDTEDGWPAMPEEWK